MLERGSALFATSWVALLACSGEAIIDASASHASVASTTASTGGSGGTNLGTGGSPADPCLEECGSVSEASGCLQCALETNLCQEEYALCLEDPSCFAYEQCRQFCSDVPCTQRCQKSYPEGSAIYGSLFYCLSCAPMQPDCSTICQNSCTIP